jgi:ABC-type taurine transport system substrate-binding protein
MASSGMLRRVALARTDVWKELSASIIMVTRIGELGTTLAVTSNRSTPILVTMMMEALSPSETSVLTRATRRNIPEDAIPLRYHVGNSDSIVFRKWSAIQCGSCTGLFEVACSCRNTQQRCTRQPTVWSSSKAVSRSSLLHPL